VKSLKNFCEKVFKNNCEIGVKVWIKKNESLNLKKRLKSCKNGLW
jgi:hypothetical protein